MRTMLFMLLLAGPLCGQTVKLPTEVKVAPGRLAAVTVDWDGDDVRWASPPDLDVFREYDPDPKKVRLRLIGYAPGKYVLFAVACKGGKLSDFATCSIVVGDPVPPPPPAMVTVPSVLGKDFSSAQAALKAVGLVGAASGGTEGTVQSQAPLAGVSVAGGTTVVLTMSVTPPEPPAPIPLDGFRVLIVEETAERGKLTAGQQAAILGKTVRDYLNSHCVKEGRMAAYWIIDKDVAVGQLAKHWQDAFARPRKSLPWIVVSNGKTGFEGPLPEYIDDTLKLLKKYSGD